MVHIQFSKKMCTRRATSANACSIIRGSLRSCHQTEKAKTLRVEVYTCGGHWVRPGCRNPRSTRTFLVNLLIVSLRSAWVMLEGFVDNKCRLISAHLTGQSTLDVKPEAVVA